MSDDRFHAKKYDKTTMTAEAMRALQSGDEEDRAAAMFWLLDKGELTNETLWKQITALFGVKNVGRAYSLDELRQRVIAVLCPKLPEWVAAGKFVIDHNASRRGAIRRVVSVDGVKVTLSGPIAVLECESPLVYRATKEEGEGTVIVWSSYNAGRFAPAYTVTIMPATFRELVAPAPVQADYIPLDGVNFPR